MFFFPHQPNLMENFVNFFKCSLNFRAHALQSKLNKVQYTNFVKFRLKSMSFKIERVFEEITKNVFFFILPTPILTKLFHIQNIHTIYVLNTFFYVSIHECHKSGKNNFFLKSLTFYETKQTLNFFFFTHTTQNKSGTSKWPVVERRQDQHEISHV